MNRKDMCRPTPGGKKKKRHALHIQRRNMDVTGALVRCLLACAAFILVSGVLSVSGAYGRMPAIVSVLVQGLLTVLCFGLTALYGLTMADGDQTDKLLRQALGAQQLRYLALAGVLLVCPATLLTDLFAAMAANLGLPVSAWAAAPAFSLFLPMFVRSVLIAPICEEAFFRGYFMAALREAGSRYALLLSALFFALCHGVGISFVPHVLLGLLLGGVMMKMQSLPAAIVLHAAYNLAVMLLSFFGLGGFFTDLGLVSCFVRLLGGAAFFAVLRLALSARPAHRTLVFGGRLSLRQSILVAAAAVMLIAACMLLQLDWKPGIDRATAAISTLFDPQETSAPGQSALAELEEIA